MECCVIPVAATMQSSGLTEKPRVENDMVDDTIIPDTSSCSSISNYNSPTSSTCPLTMTSATSSASTSPSSKFALTSLSPSASPGTSPNTKFTPSDSLISEPLLSLVPDRTARNTEQPKADDISEEDVFQSRVMDTQKETAVLCSASITPASSPSRSPSFPSSASSSPWPTSSRSISSSSSLSDTSLPNTRSSPHQTHLKSTMAVTQIPNSSTPAPTSLRLPRTLTKPPFKSVEPKVISALDPDLDEIPLPYIINMLSRVGPRMIAALARTSATINTGSGDSNNDRDMASLTSTLPRELVVTVAPDISKTEGPTVNSSSNQSTEPDIGIEFDTLPTHLLAVYSRPSGKIASANGSPNNSQRRKVTLFPTHGIVLAAHCAHLPALPQGRKPSLGNDVEKGEKDEGREHVKKAIWIESESESEKDRIELNSNSNSGNGQMKSTTSPSSVQVTLPVIPLCIPSPGTFPLLQAYLYTKRTDKLLGALIPAIPSLSRMMSGPGLGVSHTQPSTSSASAFVASPADLSRQLSAAFLPNILLAATLRTHELWANIIALGIFDDNLWRAVNYAWKVLVGALEVAQMQTKISVKTLSPPNGQDREAVQ
ncbi:hypothetical protein Clacol_010596 [Clathrus columnatus]|uniref:Uncharacterized protein n=1 Tax=Clathrus columnatus TaxID=1419009 RepID=A0AAV5AUD1_9AGAM|nr:hypothetical protein Clacol_010596 [Clathrus columnatus]